ncbi:MAG TPA: hypothetical protein VIQ31_27080 [Phormidium sp.]
MIISELKAWIQIFGGWLKVQEKRKPLPLMTEERYQETPKRVLECRLSLLADDDPKSRRPGAVATWNLIHKDAPTGGLLLTLDNLVRLQLELDPKRQSTEIVKRGLERSMGLTHRFQATWIFKSAQSSNLRFVMITAFDVDLSSHYIDEAAREVLRYAALDAFNMRAIPSVPWRERIYHFPWYESIAQISPRKGCPTQPRVRALCRRVQNVTIR